MEFSELFKQSKNLCKFSPNGKYLGCIIQYRLVIRNAHDLEIVNLFNFTDNLQAICWSRDSTLIACASFNLGSIQIWNLVDPNWSCRIDEGLGGLTKILFSPDSRHLLTFSDFQLRITVWNLINKSVRYMQYPKFDNKGFCFRKDGKYFSLVERKECKDFISVFDCEDWEMVKHFQTDTFDLEDIAWSPDGRFIAAWESSLDYKVLLYFPDGRLVSTFSREITGLGIKSVKWSPSAQFLAVGGYDKKIRILNNYTWKPIIELDHPNSIAAHDIKIYQEVNYETKLNSFDTSDKIFENLYNKTRKGYELVDVEKFPFKIPILKLIPEKPNPKMGVGLLEFNCDGRYLVSRNDNMPNCLWVWDLLHLRQISLIFQNQNSVIKLLKWNPLKTDCFAFLCVEKDNVLEKTSATPNDDDFYSSNNSSFIYIWEGEEKGVKSIEISSAGFNVNQFEWNSDGESVLLMDKEKFCLGYNL